VTGCLAWGEVKRMKRELINDSGLVCKINDSGAERASRRHGVTAGLCYRLVLQVGNAPRAVTASGPK
jgi:hypothetical protein